MCAKFYSPRYITLMNVQDGAYAKLDVLSVVYSTVDFGSLLFSFSSVGSRGWSDIGVIVSTYLFVSSQVQSEQLLLLRFTRRI